MWPFLKNNKDGKTAHPVSESKRKPMAFTEIVAGMGDYSDLGKHDVALKFWLPEPAEKAIGELCCLNGDSMSESLRQFFVIHCYGLYALTVMKNNIPGLFKDPESVLGNIRETYAPPGKKRNYTYWVPELGKNVSPVKVWLPKRVRNDLQVLANHVGIKLSQYLREIVVSRLLGHGTLPKRPEMFTVIPNPAAEDWCNDSEVPWRQVDYKRFCDAQISECRTEWVDDAGATKEDGGGASA
jgi:hypothetical protein